MALMKSLTNLILWGTQELKKTHISNPSREANLIMQLVINKPPIILKPSTILTNTQIEKYQKFINRRTAHEPFAYLAGKVTFCGNQILVNKHVLIPRPETEELVGIIQKENQLKNLKAADIGTGSGAIAICLCQNLKNAKITASDASKHALNIARKNIANHNLSNKINLVSSDLFKNISARFDLIASNLPYIPEEEFNNLKPDITNYEPPKALFSKENGLALIKKLIREAKNHLQPNGKIYLEIWHTQARDISQYSKTLYPHSKITVYKDLTGLDRFIKLEKII